MFTYQSLGEPSLQPQAMVSTLAAPYIPYQPWVPTPFMPFSAGFAPYVPYPVMPFTYITAMQC